MILSPLLGLEDRQITTTTSKAGAQQFAEAMNAASASAFHPQPGPTPNPQPGPPPGHPRPASGQSQCNPSMFWKGMAEYALAGAEGAAFAIFAVGAASGGGGDPVAGALVGALGGSITVWELGAGTFDVLHSKCV